MLTAIAIDDEPDALDVIKMHSAKVSFVNLAATFTNAFEGIRYLQEQKPDLLFLDIKMPDISGIEVLKCLQSTPMIIFTTAYSEYAIEGFDLNAVDYLLKPFSLVRFTKACSKALSFKQLHQSAQSYLFIKTGYEEEKVFLKDILYIQSDGNYVTIILPDKKLLSRMSMPEILQILPSDNFIRIHRSYIISLDKIEKISKHEITVAGVTLPVGISYEDKLDEIREKTIKK